MFLKNSTISHNPAYNGVFLLCCHHRVPSKIDLAIVNMQSDVHNRNCIAKDISKANE